MVCGGQDRGADSLEVTVEIEHKFQSSVWNWKATRWARQLAFVDVELDGCGVGASKLHGT